MRKFNFHIIAFVWLLCSIMATACADQAYTISADSSVRGLDYVLIILDGSRNDVALLEDNVLYIQQKTATGGAIIFQNVRPLESSEATAFIVSEKGTVIKCQMLETIDTVTITLPLATKEIGTEAFKGIWASTIKIPEGVVSISIRAFADCPNLNAVYIPSSVTTIEEKAFQDSPYVIIYCCLGSTAEKYAQQYGIKYVIVE